LTEFSAFVSNREGSIFPTRVFSLFRFFFGIKKEMKTTPRRKNESKDVKANESVKQKALTSLPAAAG
jgi:hypothetical protein